MPLKGVVYNEIDPFCVEWLKRLILADLIAPGDVDDRSILDVSPDDWRGYAQVHAFAGIGVWSYALRQAGWADDRPVWTGSCPCQPFSQAGGRGGFADERHLWPAWHWHIDKCRPDIVLGEQVASKDGLAWGDLVLTDLEGSGYGDVAVPLDLFEYQETGAAFLASKHRAAVFDDPGVGKTAQAIRALDTVRARRCVIVCPAAVREVWIGEFRKFARLPRKVLKGSDIQHLNLWLRGKVDVLVLSYHMARAWAKRMEGDLFDAIVFDESHYLKNRQTDWTRVMLGSDCDGRYGLARWAEYAWFLSGTPNPNDAADIWSVMRFCKATPCSHRIFTDRYFRKRVGTYSTSHEVRTEMLPELKLAIQSFSIRRTKKDAGLQLPPIWLTTINVDGDSREIRDLLRQHPNLEGAILEAVNKGGLSFLEAGHIMTLRRLVAEAKAPAFVELLLEELKDGLGKTVVFGVHKRALGYIAEGLRRAGVRYFLFDGSTSERDRGDYVRDFQQSSENAVFIGNIRAAGSGLTLTASADVIMFESDWSPAGNAQALMRVHRIGQGRTVHARFVTLSNSIDEMVNDAVARKTRDLIKLGTFSDIAA